MNIPRPNPPPPPTDILVTSLDNCFMANKSVRATFPIFSITSEVVKKLAR